jgi:hypothetical protein
MTRIILLAWFAVPIALVAEEPEKPATFKDDELAVLFDVKSPDRAKLFERYERKLVQLDGKLFYYSSQNGVKTPSSGEKAHYFIDPPKGGIKDAHASVPVEWSNNLQNVAVQNHVKKRSGEFGAMVGLKREDTYSKWAVTTVYGRFSKGKLLEAATDPKIVGQPIEEKKKEPARLKD